MGKISRFAQLAPNETSNMIVFVGVPAKTVLATPQHRPTPVAGSGGDDKVNWRGMEAGTRGERSEFTPNVRPRTSWATDPQFAPNSPPEFQCCST